MNKLLRRALILLTLLMPGHALADSVEVLRGFYARTTTIQTSFVQKIIDESGAVTDVMTGKLWLSRPSQFRWEYVEPYEQVMVNDGLRLWIYDMDLAQVTVRDAAEALAGAPVWLLNGGPALDEQFTLVAEASDDGLAWVRMTPRDESSDFKLARMALENGLPSRLELTDSLGQQTIIRFEGLGANVVIPKERFSFTPPADVEVVEG